VLLPFTAHIIRCGRNENRVLRRIFGMKRDEVIGGWRKLHKEEFHNVYSAPSLIIMIKTKSMMGRTCSTHGEKTNSYTILVGNPQRRTPLVRHRRKWKDNAIIDLREIGWSGMGWVHLTQDGDHWRALVNTVMNLRVP
jgi:hypothetical protein